MTIDSKVALIAVFDRAERYRALAIKSRDRSERETYQRIVELDVKIAEEPEALMGG